MKATIHFLSDDIEVDLYADNHPIPTNNYPSIEIGVFDVFIGDPDMLIAELLNYSDREFTFTIKTERPKSIKFNEELSELFRLILSNNIHMFNI